MAEPFEAKWSYSWFRTHRWYIAAIVLSLGVLELTADPGLVIVVSCSKFGWEQILTARWISRNDPDVARRRAAFWSYLAWGLWRISLVGIALFSIAVGFIYALDELFWMGRPTDSVFLRLVIVIFAALAGFALATISSLIGIVLAWRGSVRLWVGPEAVVARKLKAWPPEETANLRNRLNFHIHGVVPIVYFGMILPAIFLILIVAVEALKPTCNELVLGGVATIIGMVALYLGLPVMSHFSDFVVRRISAESIEECWPADQDGTPPSSNHSAIGNAL